MHNDDLSIKLIYANFFPILLQLCKIYSEGKARKVVGCSCVVVKVEIPCIVFVGCLKRYIDLFCGLTIFFLLAVSGHLCSSTSSLTKSLTYEIPHQLEGFSSVVIFVLEL